MNKKIKLNANYQKKNKHNNFKIRYKFYNLKFKITNRNRNVILALLIYLFKIYKNNIKNQKICAKITIFLIKTYNKILF